MIHSNSPERQVAVPDALLEARGLYIHYGERIAVADISIRALAGEIVAIIGPNGAGKSTLMRALNGSLAPSRGGVILDGQALRSFSRRAVGKRVAVVAQEAELRFPITVMEFILGGRYAWSGMRAWGWETERDMAVAREVLGETELTDFGTRLMNELSGGERQRAVLARALATEASVLLLDEPTANLDLAHQATLLQLVRARCDQKQAAAIVVTHDINLAAEFADRIVLLANGRSVASGSPREVLTPELLRQVFSIEVLVDANPVTGAPRITPVHHIAGGSKQMGNGAREDGWKPSLPAQL